MSETSPQIAKLSVRQRTVLEMIQQFVESNGYTPSMQDIADACGFKSLASVSYQLTQLEEAGVIRRDLGRARGIELLTDEGVGQIFRTALEAIRRGETVDVPAWLDAGPAERAVLHDGHLLS